jgi:hypothetical protein
MPRGNHGVCVGAYQIGRASHVWCSLAAIWGVLLPPETVDVRGVFRVRYPIVDVVPRSR